MTTARYKRGARGARLTPPPDHRARAILTLLAEQLEAAIGGVAAAGAADLVDFGCAEAPYRPLVEAAGMRYVGADLEGNPAADLTIAADGSLPLADASVDCVLSTQVLEHVEDPHAYLVEARRVLRGGGALVLSTHGHYRLHGDPQDYWRWTLDGLCRQLDAAGFAVRERRSVLGLATSGLQFLQDGLVNKVPRRARGGLCRAVQRLILWRERRAPAAVSPDAAVYVVVAGVRDPAGPGGEAFTGGSRRVDPDA
jgi:SAM-dependent methyltransferase